MKPLAIIAGTGLYDFPGLENAEDLNMCNRWGEVSSAIRRGTVEGRQVCFMTRHGRNHKIPPHEINYRANIQALHDLGCEDVIAITAVGGINRGLKNADLAIPDQLIDYTWGRSSTFFEKNLEDVVHVDFGEPYCPNLRDGLGQAACKMGIQVPMQMTYGATQGPRLETRAEIDRMERDGCDLVGMTGMPEAVLARELGMNYANLSVVVNMAAGRSPGPITMDDIRLTLNDGMAKVTKLLKLYLMKNSA
ncbi:S-methyl-5'-thioinosine phosphorylase [Pelagibaculum spongiae]|uniref:S-methyl-5'-thioinosine phosphorylase n=1 Tax=Pelagibaculum spongiae TaxID=2080658 RepID=UPI0019D47A35|nr:S-methyl-5'-thioinosine phosphorylase [Pelagibaculum spongiae]